MYMYDSAILIKRCLEKGYHTFDVNILCRIGFYTIFIIIGPKTYIMNILLQKLNNLAFVSGLIYHSPITSRKIV